MTSFDTLNTLGTELTGEQLDSVDGGLIGFVVGFALGVYVGVQIASSL